jgi:hypothetical protein
MVHADWVSKSVFSLGHPLSSLFSHPGSRLLSSRKVKPERPFFVAPSRTVRGSSQSFVGRGLGFSVPSEQINSDLHTTSKEKKLTGIITLYHEQQERLKGRRQIALPSNMMLAYLLWASNYNL